MVAVKGRGWVLAPSAERAVREADEIAPHRSRASDGSIGDQAHAARSSFHNPQDGYVDAVDITHDPAGGFDAHAHADEVVASQPDHLDHIISNRRVASAARGWMWRPYTGSNGHTQHIHLANKRNAQGRNWTGRLFSEPAPAPIPQEDDMAVIYVVQPKAGPDGGKAFYVDGGKRRHLDSDDSAGLRAAGVRQSEIDAHGWQVILDTTTLATPNSGKPG